MDRAEERDAVRLVKLVENVVTVPAVIITVLHFVSSLQGGRGIVNFPFITIISIYLTLLLILLAAFMPLPPLSYFFNLTVFTAFLALATLLSDLVPKNLAFLPFLACLRPFFHLLPHPIQLCFFQYSLEFWDEVILKAPLFAVVTFVAGVAAAIHFCCSLGVHRECGCSWSKQGGGN